MNNEWFDLIGAMNIIDKHADISVTHISKLTLVLHLTVWCALLAIFSSAKCYQLSEKQQTQRRIEIKKLLWCKAWFKGWLAGVQVTSWEKVLSEVNTLPLMKMFTNWGDKQGKIEPDGDMVLKQEFGVFFVLHLSRKKPAVNTNVAYPSVGWPFQEKVMWF